MASMAAPTLSSTMPFTSASLVAGLVTRFAYLQAGLGVLLVGLGAVSTTFIAGALFRKAAGLDLVHVPFKSAPDAVTAPTA